MTFTPTTDTARRTQSGDPRAWQGARFIEALRGRMRQGSGALVRVAVPLAASDPWALLEWALGEGEEVFAWRDGRSGLCVLGLGVAEAIAAEGAARFEVAREACSRWHEECVEVGLGGVFEVPEVPLAWAGFAFSSEVEGAEAARWRGWGGGRVVVPEVILWRLGDRRGAVVTRRCEAGASPEAVWVEVAGRLSALERALEQAADRTPEPEGEEPGVEAGGEGEAWRGLVSRATGAISEGSLQKVVLARDVRISAPVGGRFDVAATVRRLRQAHEGAFVFCMGDGQRGHFVGATPELLVRLDGRRVHTHVLAGTVRRGGSEAEDEALGRALLDSAKDRHEHALTAKAIEGALEPLCEALRVSGTPRIRRLRDVQHLETPVEGMLSAPTNILSLVEALHPTPAVGGLPRGPALDWLDAHEGLERGLYAGPVGWIGAEGQGAFAVAIRSALVRDGEAYAFVGAGIVEASDPALEWQETGLKLETASRALITRRGSQ